MKVFIRTLTYHYIGRVSKETEKEITLDECIWVADSGEFTNCIKNGALDEVEIIGDNVRLIRNNIIDIIPWTHEIPSERK